MGNTVGLLEDVAIEMAKPEDGSDLSPHSEALLEEIKRLRRMIRTQGEAAGLQVDSFTSCNDDGEDLADPPLTLSDLVKKSFYAQFDTVNAAFIAADTSGGGTITLDEFTACIKDSGLDVTDDQAACIMKRHDTNKDGMISYQEFMNFLISESVVDEETEMMAKGVTQSLRNQIDKKFHSMRDAFLAVDTDRSGCIDASEVQETLRTSGHSDEEIKLMVAAFPHKKEGGFSYVEFCTMIEGQSPFSR